MRAAEVVELSVRGAAGRREGAGCGVVFPRGTRELYAVLSVRSAPGSVELVWRFGDEVTQRQRLAVRALRGEGFRTWGRQRLLLGRQGAWSVEVLDGGGRRIGGLGFTVGVEPGGAGGEEPGADGGRYRR
ncbi:MAG: DUF2914 domain-containing protein [bacterium]